MNPSDDPPLILRGSIQLLQLFDMSYSINLEQAQARLVKPGILDQLDLLAMDNGYTIKRGETDPASGWVDVTFLPGGCEHTLLGDD